MILEDGAKKEKLYKFTKVVGRGWSKMYYDKTKVKRLVIMAGKLTEG